MTESTTINTRVLLAARPNGYPAISDFEIDTAPIPTPGLGDILVRTL
jgi:NADPH-dependent curcumin reductase CurA